VTAELCGLRTYRSVTTIPPAPPPAPARRSPGERCRRLASDTRRSTTASRRPMTFSPLRGTQSVSLSIAPLSTPRRAGTGPVGCPDELPGSRAGVPAQSFADLLGQDAVVQTLRNALSSDTLAHAYLFSGLRGVGKTTAARCWPRPSTASGARPRSRAGSASPASRSPPPRASTWSSSTRPPTPRLRRSATCRSSSATPDPDRFRVMIVDEVHMLSPSSFNALLKTIEEPPPYVLWIFATTDRSKVPATILSAASSSSFDRCPSGRSPATSRRWPAEWVSR